MVFLSKKRTLEILEKAKPGDKVSQYSDFLLSTLIILNLLAVSLESVESIGSTYRKQFYVFEVFSVSIFLVEYLLRIWATVAKYREILNIPSSSERRRKAKMEMSIS